MIAWPDTISCPCPSPRGQESKLHSPETRKSPHSWCRHSRACPRSHQYNENHTYSFFIIKQCLLCYHPARIAHSAAGNSTVGGRRRRWWVWSQYNDFRNYSVEEISQMLGIGNKKTPISWSFKRRLTDLNRRSGSCSPTPYHLAKSPYLIIFASFFFMIQMNSPSRARTYNNSVNSRVLYHWAIEESVFTSWSHFSRNDNYNRGCSLKTEYKNIFILIFPILPFCHSIHSVHWHSLTAFLSLPPRISLRPISDIQLSALLHLHPCPIYLVVFKGSYPLTWGIPHLGGGFTLRCLQRLSLPDLATLPWRWSPTGAPAVRPSRSSRTKDGSPQISCARAG